MNDIKLREPHRQVPHDQHFFILMLQITLSNNVTEAYTILISEVTTGYIFSLQSP